MLSLLIDTAAWLCWCVPCNAALSKTHPDTHTPLSCLPSPCRRPPPPPPAPPLPRHQAVAQAGSEVRSAPHGDLLAPVQPPGCLKCTCKCAVCAVAQACGGGAGRGGLPGRCDIEGGRGSARGGSGEAGQEGDDLVGGERGGGRASVLCALWLRLVEEAQAEEGYLAGVSWRYRVSVCSIR
jgi:hypothetical protein